ncbi:FecR family protein [Sunxiuqinia rutila]|uniref:FecR family protein n=1 Tax=Sunxiuqinia rutila TaxID=1397841 RepID=UPI003D367D54
MDKRLLHKFVSDQCTSKEIDEFFASLDKLHKVDLKNKSLFENYWNDIDITENPNTEAAQRRLDRIHHSINLNQSNPKRDTKTLFLISKKLKVSPFLSRVAVFLLMPILTLLIYTHFIQPEIYSLLSMSSKYEIEAPAGSRTHFVLPDGTKVWLNQGSKLVYPKWFTGGVREVGLIGEGYFDVAPDKKKPFIVEANGMAVKAVGTSFNVRAYADNENFETTLESGKVIVLKNGNDINSEVCDMQPGDHFSFNKLSNKYSITKVNTSKYVSWKDGKLVFKDDGLGVVADRLSRWFNVKVTIADPDLNSLSYTATFIDESLDQVLEMMEVVTPISYTFSSRHKLSDGTFSEKEILIYKKGGKTE